MRSAIGWTYNLLTSFQRQLLRRLSVAGGTFGIDDAVALSDGELSEVLDALSALVDFHLVLPASSDGVARLELAPSIRALMAEHLAASGEAADVEARWIGWLAAQARNAARGISAEEPDSWWVWLDGAHDCLRNALQKCLEYRRAEPALDIAAALAPYWDARAGHAAHSRLLDETIKLAAESGIQSAAFAEVLLWSGLLGTRVLFTETADRYAGLLKQGEELAHKLADERLILLAAHCRVLTTAMTGDVAGGVQATAQGLDIARQRRGMKLLYQQGDLGQGIRIGVAELEPNAQSDITAFERCYGISFLGLGAGGGGVSSVWCMPDYQHRTVIPGIVNAHSGKRSSCASGYAREVPDISGWAEPADGYSVFYNGGWVQFGIGGTSGAAPLWASIAALTDVSRFCSAYGSKGATLPQNLYNTVAAHHSYIYSSKPQGVQDVTEGSDASANIVTGAGNDYTESGYTGGLYPTTRGYDMASGLGTPLVDGRNYSTGTRSAFIPGLAQLECRQSATRRVGADGGHQDLRRVAVVESYIPGGSLH